MKTVLITGSSGLIGSEAVTYFDARGWNVIGFDNNMRETFFGAAGNTAWNLERLRRETKHFISHEIDIRDRELVLKMVRKSRPNLIVHCAGQPSHDKAASIPFIDFEVNAVGTLNLLEAMRQYCPESPFVFMSTNKVYGDAPNEVPLRELETRFDYEEGFEGIDETMGIDQCVHSLFGVSKASADLMAQEYGYYFGLPVGIFRGGCLSGPNHSGVVLHGFLSWMVRAAKEGRTYEVFGYKGKQVRDNIHSYDVVTAIEAFAEDPSCGAVFNIGGGRANSISILEAIRLVEDVTGRPVKTVYRDEPRKGDHVCYITDYSKFKCHFPQWSITRSVEDMIREMCAARN